MLTASDKRNSIELLTSFPEKHSGFEVNEDQVDKVVKKIWKKVVNCGDCKLDKSILEAHIDELFFLGKLKELNETVTSDRKKINQLVEEVVQYISEIQKEEDRNNGKIEGGHELSEKLQKIIDKYMQRFAGDRFLGELQRQFNKKLMIPTYSHFMTGMTRTISNIFNQGAEPQINDLKTIGTLFFDLDGLKMLNDMSLDGYNSGDKALWVMARALTDKNLITWAGKQGIELIPTHYHGDEFLLGVVAERGVDLTDDDINFKGVNGEDVRDMSMMEYIGRFVKNRIGEFGKQRHSWGSVGNNSDIAPSDIQNIIDFSNSEQMKKFDKAKISWLVNDPDLENIFTDDFQYRLSCSYGYSTLKDAIIENIKNRSNFPDSTMSYEDIIYVLTRYGLISVAEKKLKIDKTNNRKRRRSSNNPQERLLEHLYRTGRERREGYVSRDDYSTVEKTLFDFRDEVLELRDKLKEEKIKSIRERRARRSAKIRYGAMLTREVEQNKRIESLQNELARVRARLKEVENNQ